jgi:hypothetical protein
MLIHKPGTKHMADRSRLVQTSSKEDNPPRNFCTRAIKELLDGLIPTGRAGVDPEMDGCIYQ